jgi:hypothetical protein
MERDKAGQFLPRNGLGGGSGTPVATQTPADDDKRPNGILSQHRASLARLKEGYEQSGRLRQEGTEIRAELETIATTFDALSDKLWAGEAVQPELERLNSRRSALEAVQNKLGQQGTGGSSGVTETVAWRYRRLRKAS